MANEKPQQSIPSSPTNGSRLPVLGNSAGAGSAGFGGCMTNTTKIGMSAGGGGGGGGILPVSFFSCSITVSGSSTTLVAETFIPFFRPHASTIWPFTLNFCLVPSSKLRMTDVGGVTCQTFPVTLCTVVIILSVLVVATVCSSFIPG